MPFAVDVAFKNMERSEAVESRILSKTEKLSRVEQRMTRCRVVVEAPHHHRAQGNLYDVRIDIHVPGGEILINRENGKQDPAHSDVYVAIRDAFDAALRKLAEHRERQIGH
jgi:ribosome-associated translation inhibitor RaiA